MSTGGEGGEASPGTIEKVREVEDILDNSRLVESARKKMEEDLEKSGRTIRAPRGRGR